MDLFWRFALLHSCKMRLTHILFFINSAIILSVKAQDTFAFDNCDLITCPLDCHLVFPDGEECPTCNCPLGQRCPQLNCPPEPMCLKVQRLDGCLDCACAGTTYRSFDERQNMATFVMTPTDKSVTETCNLYDIQSVQRCMKELVNYMKIVERRSPDIVAHPMVAMFLYSRTELLEICNLYSQSVRCVSTDTRVRCADQERHMHMMISTFDYMCTVRQRLGDDLERYLNQYECIHNILVAHVNADQCSNKMIRRFDRTSKDDSIHLQTKRQRKCETLNEFIDCIEPTLNTFCGKTAARTFRNGLLNATNAIAPECKSNGNIFVPIFVTERSSGQLISNQIQDRRLVIR